MNILRLMINHLFSPSLQTVCSLPFNFSLPRFCLRLYIFPNVASPLCLVRQMSRDNQLEDLAQSQGELTLNNEAVLEFFSVTYGINNA